jgi:chromatin segregation and condensation protein Rec8/ScpA/Scc1 (kleisin family)
MIAVMELLQLRERCEFVELVKEEGRWLSRPIIVATFLAILELTRLAALGLYQGVNVEGIPEGPIHVRRLGDPGDAGWAARISELM